MNYSEIVKSKRKQMEMSQPDFAALIGVNTATVWRWEHKKAEPSKATLAFIEQLESATTTPQQRAAQ